MMRIALAALAALGLCWWLGQPTVWAAGQFLENGPLPPVPVPADNP
jgi:hypothetical protein